MKFTSLLKSIIVEQSRFEVLLNALTKPGEDKEGKKSMPALSLVICTAHRKLMSRVDDLQKENEATNARLREDAKALARKEEELEEQRRQLAEAKRRHDEEMFEMQKKQEVSKGE